MPLLENRTVWTNKSKYVKQRHQVRLYGMVFPSFTAWKRDFYKKKKQKPSYSPARTQRTKRSEVLVNAPSSPSKTSTTHAKVVELTSVVEDQ